MNMQPNEQQLAQYQLAQEEILEALVVLEDAGLETPTILAALAYVAASIVDKEFGIEAVPKWFAVNALETRRRIGTSH